IYSSSVFGRMRSANGSFTADYSFDGLICLAKLQKITPISAIFALFIVFSRSCCPFCPLPAYSCKFF
ncbi:MAG: hypothetical protein KIG52_09415, partial [Muribaculaceae bacterium]|nr:hypothetical protein [Muribaculaceae bacterium]